MIKEFCSNKPFRFYSSDTNLLFGLGNSVASTIVMAWVALQLGVKYVLQVGFYQPADLQWHALANKLRRSHTNIGPHIPWDCLAQMHLTVTKLTRPSVERGDACRCYKPINLLGKCPRLANLPSKTRKPSGLQNQ